MSKHCGKQIATCESVVKMRIVLNYPSTSSVQAIEIRCRNDEKGSLTNVNFCNLPTNPLFWASIKQIRTIETASTMFQLQCVGVHPCQGGQGKTIERINNIVFKSIRFQDAPTQHQWGSIGNHKSNGKGCQNVFYVDDAPARLSNYGFGETVKTVGEDW